VAPASSPIRVARLQSGVAMPPLVTSLIESEDGLALRVHRLLRNAPVEKTHHHVGVLAIVTLGLLAAAVNPASLRFVHFLLERLLD
jgi:hypothetical protein